jgi:arylsulfate sulfotransferase
LRPLVLGIMLSSSLFVSAILISGCNGGGASEPAITMKPSQAMLLPGQTLQFNVTAGLAPVANLSWSVNGIAGGTASTGTISSSGLYTAPAASSAKAVQIRVTDPTQRAFSATATVSFFDPNNFQPGIVSASNNPLVATYALTAPLGTSAQIQFGTTTNYGLTTWAQGVPEAGGLIVILVAGMRASSTYHMQAIVHLPNGNTVLDADHVFTTGAIPAALLPNITIQQGNGMTPASGVEMLNLIEETSQTALTALVTDLEGNVVWYYPVQPDEPFPIKLLPNGHMLLVEQAHQLVQEIDLAGDVIWQISLADIQQRLAAVGINWPLAIGIGGLHHDILRLPNGHLILLVDYMQTLTDQTGSPTVTGDGLIDWDPQNGPVWTWSTFDHIPLAHAPYGASDWTHANAVVYSPNDGNLLLSMRNQNWIVKIRYENGAGDGSILWHLGPGGDFTLPNGQQPMEWNYGQHYPTFQGTSTDGIFPLLLFNNGNGRLNASNVPCGTSGGDTCYSSVPLYQLNEYTLEAEVLSEYRPISPNQLQLPAFSVCCGSTNLLPNGDLEYDVALDQNTPGASYIQEVTQEQNPQRVWGMNIFGQLAYRGFRIPSLYPGVSWTQAAIATANVNATAQPTRKADLKQAVPFTPK